MDRDVISARQLYVLLFAALLSPAVRALPCWTVGTAGRGAWLTGLGALPVLLLAAWVLRGLVRKGPVGLVERCLDALGPVLGRGLLLVYIMWGLFLLALEARLYGERMVAAGGKNASLPVLLLILLALVLWMGRKKLAAFARAAEIFYLILIVALGVVLGLVLLLVSKGTLSHRVKKSSLDSGRHGALLAECKKRLGVRAEIPLVVQEYLPTPALFGLFRPQILLPEYCRDMGDESLSFILLHELSHYKRKDMLLNYLLLGLQLVYWFNPLVWFMFRQIREDMELLNDEQVLKQIGQEQGKNYARALVETLARGQRLPLAPKLLCMASGKQTVERRINMIQLRETFQKHKWLTAALCLAMICLLSGFFLTKPGSGGGSRPLTQAEIDQVNESFAQLIPVEGSPDQLVINPISHFFTSYYSSIEELDLEQFIWYFPGSQLDGANKGDVEQFEALKKLEQFPFQNATTIEALPMPLQRKPLQEVEALLEQYGGIGVKDLKTTGTALYLPAPYDAFYTYTSDAGMGFFTCNGGRVEGDRVQLQSEYATLTLEKRGGEYLITSHVANK